MWYHQTNSEAAEAIRREGFRYSGEHIGDDLTPRGIYLKRNPELVLPNVLGNSQLRVRPHVSNTLQLGAKFDEERKVRDLFDVLADCIGEEEAQEVLDNITDWSIPMDDRANIAREVAVILTDCIESEGYDSVSFPDPYSDEDNPLEYAGEVEALVVFDPDNVEVID